MSTKLLAGLFYALAVLLFAVMACLADNFQTVGERMRWFLVVSGSLFFAGRMLFVLFSYARPRDK